MSLLSLDDPLYVVDLTRAARRECRAELDREPGAGDAGQAARELEPAPPRPIRAVALVIELEDDPLLVAIEPTFDMRMLDALARLLRVGITTGTAVGALATAHGDAYIRRLYFERGLPDFVYSGLPAGAREQAPEELLRILGGRRP